MKRQEMIRLWHTNTTGISKRRVVMSAGAVLLIPLASACGSTSSSPSSQSAPMPSISVGIPAVSLSEGQIYLAQDLGYFRDAGVDVTITNLSATAITKLAAGQVDVIAYGGSADLPIIAQRRPVKVLYADVYGDPVGVMVESSAPYKTIEDLAGKKVAVIGTTGVLAGTARAMSNYLQKKGLQPLQVVSVADASGETALLESGQVDAMFGAIDIAGTQITTNRFRFIYSPANQVPADIPGTGPVPTTVMSALSTTIQSKPQAFARFFAAVAQAGKYLASTPPAEVAAVLAKDPAYSGYSQSTLEAFVKYYAPLYEASKMGLITPSLWQQTLNTYANYGLGLDMTNPKFSYGNAVDMAPLNQGLALGIKFASASGTN